MPFAVPLLLIPPARNPLEAGNGGGRPVPRDAPERVQRRATPPFSLEDAFSTGRLSSDASAPRGECWIHRSGG